MAIKLEDLPPAARKQAEAQVAAQLGEKGQEVSKPSKMRNVVDYRGKIRFASKKEARRYDELMLMLRAGKIRNLKLQPTFTLIESYKKPESGETVKPLQYRADFSYERMVVDNWGYERWLPVVEDVKSPATKTRVYLNKRKQFREKYGFDITEV